MGKLSDEECYLIAQKYTNSCNFTLVEFVDDDKEEGEGPAGFLGVPGHITIKIKEPMKDEVTSLNFFVKSVPRGNAKKAELIRSLKVYYKESQLYEQILEKFTKIIHGNIFPKYYFSRPDDILVLEDLSFQGFKPKSNYDLFDYEHCKITLEAVAKFHAASIIFEETNGLKIDQKIQDLLFEVLFVSDPSHASFNHICVSFNALDSILEAYFSHIPSEVCTKTSEVLRAILTSLKPSKDHLNVLTHGDLWSNNIMFSYDNNGKVKDVRIFDFQLSRYGPPAFDVLLFLYLTTTHTFREEHMGALIKNYYNELKRELSKNNFDINTILPWKEFQVTMEEELPKVLCIAPLYLHYILIPQDQLEKMAKSADFYDQIVSEDRSELTLELMRIDESYRRRVSQSLSELIQYVQNNQMKN